MANTIRTSGFDALIDAIKAARQARGLTQRDLAKRLGCQNATIANIETGQRRIDVIELIVLADALGEDPENLFKIVLEHLDPDELQNNFSRSSRW